MGISLGAAPEPAEDIEKALEAMKRRGKEASRQAQILSDEILGHQAEITAVAAGSVGQAQADSSASIYKQIGIATVVIVAIGLFLLLSGNR